MSEEYSARIGESILVAGKGRGEVKQNCLRRQPSAYLFCLTHRRTFKHNEACDLETGDDHRLVRVCPAHGFEQVHIGGL